MAHDDALKAVGMDAGLRKLLDRVRSARETILWAGRPVPRFFSPAVVLRMVSGLVCTGCILLILLHALSQMAPLTTFEAVFLFLFFTPFVLLGLLLIASPLFEYLCLRHSWYAITDSRVIICSGLFRPAPVSYPLERISQVRVAQQTGTTGNVDLVCGVRVVDGLEESQSCLVNIRYPHDVAKLLTAQIEKVRQQAAAGSTDSPDTLPPEPLLKKDPSPGEDLAKTARALPVGLLMFILGGFLLFGLPFVVSGLTGAGIPGAIFLVLLIFLLLQLRTIYLAKQSARWPSTKGVVRESYVKVEHDGQSGTGYIPKVRYTYRVNGKEYYNNEITFRQRSYTLNRKPAEEVVSRYPEGRTVTVYYHPRKPGYSVLEPGRGAGNWIVLALLAACCLASGIWLAHSWTGWHFTAFSDLMPSRVIRFYLEKLAAPGG